MGKPATIHRVSSAKSQQAETSKKRQLLSPPPSSVCSHEQITFDAQKPSPDGFFFDSVDFMQMQWQPSAFSPASILGDIDSDDPPVFPYSIDIENNSTNHLATPQLLDFGFTGPSFTLDNDLHEALTVSSPAKDGLISQPCTNSLALSLDKSPSSQPQDCASLWSPFTVFGSIRAPAARKCPTSALKSTNSIEQVLITNKAAMACMDKTLACPCSHNPHYALTLALMCHKILVRYEAIIKTPPTTSFPEDVHPPPRPENFSAPPITVGAYQMDAEDERRLRIQLVVNELRKMKRVD